MGTSNKPKNSKIIILRKSEIQKYKLKTKKMYAISNRDNFMNDMFFDQGFLNHSMRPRFAFEPFTCVRSDPRRELCLPPVIKRRQPMALSFDLLPFKRSRQNYFDGMLEKLMSANEIENNNSSSQSSFNIEKLSNVDPKNLKIKIDKNKNSITINYQKKSDNSYYQISESQTLPNFIKEHNLFEQIKCNFENGNVKISFPEEPVKAIEDEKNGKNVDERNEMEIDVEKENPEMVTIDLVSEEEEKEDEEKENKSGEEQTDKNEKIVMPGLA